MASHSIIAVDGTAASGKSTFSRSLAGRLGFVYVNTGAMYRGVTWYLQQKNVPLDDPAAIAREMGAVKVETHLQNGELLFRIGGIDPLPHVREGQVNEGVSLVAQVPEVRRLLVAEQQKLAQEAPLVMEGRDIGSVVFPQTPHKFYIDAHPDVRAQRRDRQGESDVITRRDTIDQSRKTSPLIRVTDAVFIDSSDVTVDEMVATALRHLAVRGLKTVPASDEPELPAAFVPLWDGPAPHSQGSATNDTPRLYVYLPEKSTKPAPAMLVVPGGGYEIICYGHEGVHLAEWFQQQGVAAFILFYRLPAHGYRHPVPLLDIQRAVRLIRSHAADWKIDPGQISTLGFSAGGHLVTTLATHFDAGDAKAVDPVERQSCRPDYTVAVYPVVTMKEPVTHGGSKQKLLGPDPDPALVESLSNETQVTSQTPPTLLVHSVDDEIVPIEHSRLMLAALQKAGVPSAFHEYAHGRHGFGFGPRQTAAPAGWLDKVYGWLQEQGFRV